MNKKNHTQRAREKERKRIRGKKSQWECKAKMQNDLNWRANGRETLDCFCVYWSNGEHLT